MQSKNKYSNVMYGIGIGIALTIYAIVKYQQIAMKTLDSKLLITQRTLQILIS